MTALVQLSEAFHPAHLAVLRTTDGAEVKLREVETQPCVSWLPRPQEAEQFCHVLSVSMSGTVFRSCVQACKGVPSVSQQGNTDDAPPLAA